MVEVYGDVPFDGNEIC